MSFIWHTAISVLDLGSSLIYNLLGRDLNESDIKLIEIIFNYVAKTSIGQSELKHQFDLDSKQINTLSQLLIKNLKSCNAKDLLLITNKQNGYNLVQTLVQSILQLSSNILNQSYKQILELNLENEFDHLIEQRIDLLKVLLKIYSCDPNRGLLLSNKTKYCISLTENTLNQPGTPIKEHNKRSSNFLSKKGSFCERKNSKSNNVLIDLENESTSNQEEDINECKTNLDQTKVETDTLTELTTTFETMVKNKSLNNLNTSCQSILNSSCQKTPVSPCSYITNVDLSNITFLTDEKSINQLNTTPLDTPLLILCCVYNTHNLLNLTVSNSNSKKPSKNLKPRLASPHRSSNEHLISTRASFNSIASTVKKPSSKSTQVMRRHTIHCDNVIEFQKAKTESIKTNSNNQENSDLISYWSSSSGSESESSSSSISSSFSSSLSFNSFNSSLISCYSKSADSISKLFKPSTRMQRNDFEPSDNYEDSETEFDYEEDSKEPVDLTQASFSEDSDDDSEYASDSDDDSGNDYSSNIFDYDLENDEQNYYDKYDYDVNSNCCKLNTNNLIEYQQHDQVKRLSSLSTSIHSLPSSSNHENPNKTTSHSNTNTLSSRQTYHSKNSFIYEKLNKQRLALVDLLLKYGADKYLVAKLTVANLKKLSKKSRIMLKKWYGLKSSQETVNDNETASDRDSDLDIMDNYELRPLSPIMASLCLDDVDIFSRLYEHHQTLFNYFKPDEDYELIYYAIKFQSKNCLVYLLTNTSSENLPSLFEAKMHETHQKIPHSKSAPVIRNTSQQLNQTSKQDRKNFNKNVNTMFYILENTRSSKIIKVLLKCGFDLSKREPLTGNTALHCLFNSSNCIASGNFRSKKILSEYHDPKSLSRILFIMLKNGGLKTHVNTLNYEHKLCTQVLFEWDELIELVFFKPALTESASHRSEWQREFKQCIKLLLKAGADLLLNVNNIEIESEGYQNCIETLLNSLVKHSVLHENKYKTSLQDRTRSPSLPSIIQNEPLLLLHTPRSPSKKKKNLNKKIFDIEFLYEILNDIIDLSTLTSNLKRANFYHTNHVEQMPHRLPPRDCSVEKYLEILLNTSIEDFASAIDIFKLLITFQKSLNNKLRVKFNQTNNSIRTINPQVVKKLISNWILHPNFLNSSQQFEKNNFIKTIVIELILNDLYDPNDSTPYCTPNELSAPIQSNNLLNHCVQLIFLSKTCYQLELIYDLMRTLIQYGANPNIEPFDFDSSFNYLSAMSYTPVSITAQNSPSNSILAQLCEPLTNGRRSPVLTTVNLSRPHHRHHLEYKSTKMPSNHHHHHHHHHHHNHHNYFDDYFNEKNHSTTEQGQSYQTTNLNDRVISIQATPVTPPILKTDKLDFEHKTSRRASENLISPTFLSNGRKLAPSNPILLLTPSASYVSMTLSSISNQSNLVQNSLATLKSDNIIVDSSVLFLNHYKRFVKLLYDSMETSKVIEVVKSKSLTASPEALYSPSSHSSCHHHHNHNHSIHQHRYRRNSSTGSPLYLNQSNKIYAVESLEMYLERLVTSPRSLKSLARRFILNKLVESEKKKKQISDSNDSNSLLPISVQVSKLPLPKRIKNYLLFIE